MQSLLIQGARIGLGILFELNNSKPIHQQTYYPEYFHLLLSVDEGIKNLHPDILGMLSNIPQIDKILITDSPGFEYNLQRLLDPKTIVVYYKDFFPRNVVKGVTIIKLKTKSDLFRDLQMIDDCTFHIGIVKSFDSLDRPKSIHSQLLAKNMPSILININTLEIKND